MYRLDPGSGCLWGEGRVDEWGSDGGRVGKRRVTRGRSCVWNGKRNEGWQSGDRVCERGEALFECVLESWVCGSHEGSVGVFEIHPMITVTHLLVSYLCF